MQISPIKQCRNINAHKQTFKKGLYFAKTTVLFNKEANYNNNVNGSILKSEEGFRYIKDNFTPPELKSRIAKSPFVKELSESFDTFVVCHGPFISNHFNDYRCVSELFWADYSKDYAQHKIVIGKSSKSQDDAINNMIKNLDLKKFANV